MESCDGPVLRSNIGLSFTGELPSVRDGPNVAVPPKTERETDRRMPPPGCLEPEEPPTSKQSPSKLSGSHAAPQEVHFASSAIPPQGLQTAPPGPQAEPQPCGGYKVQTKEESKPRDGLTCVHCSLVLRDAMQTEDGCRVCHSCYKDVKSKGGHCDDCGLVVKDSYSVSPDFAARKEIEKLEVLCRNSGCGWSGFLKLLEVHEIRECNFRKVACHHCAKLVSCNAMSDHVVNTCDHRSVPCGYCYESVKQFELEDHHQSCGKFKIDCVDCGESVPREELGNHWENDCEFVQCSVCAEKMLRSAVAEHLEDKVKQFKHFNSVAKEVKHLREEVRCLQQWLAEATSKAKSAAPASSDTSTDVLKLIEHLTKRVDTMEDEKESQARKLAEAVGTIDKQKQEIAALKEEVRKPSHTLQPSPRQHNSGRSFSAVNQAGEASYNFNIFGEAANPVLQETQLMASITRLQDKIHAIERNSACAQTAQGELVARLDKIDNQVQGLTRQTSRDSTSGQSAMNFEGVIDFPEATTGELFPSGGLKSSVLEQRVEELERGVSALSVQVADTDLQLQASLVTTYNGQFVWRIPDLSRRLRDAKQGKVTSIYSPPFYTSKSGYKMCIRTYLNGDGMGEKTHLSVFFVIMKGEHDALLPWPFQSRISLMLLNQENGLHITETFRPNPTSKSFQRPSSEMNVASGCPRFASLATLANPAFVKNDVLFIKCSVDTTGLVQP